jgi:hypothetical protein
MADRLVPRSGRMLLTLGRLETLGCEFRTRLACFACSGVRLALALHARGLIVLATLGLRKQAILLYLAGEAL